jgi:hypothetical protein
MSLAKIDLDKALNLEFELTVDGVKDKVNEIRFVIEGEDSSSHIYRGSYTNGIYSVRIPPLENVLESGEHDCYLEVIVDDNRYFKPMTESIEFNAPIKVESHNSKSKTVEEEIKIDGAVRVIEEESESIEEKEHDLKPVKKDSSYDPKQLKAGTEVEMEHTDDKSLAEKIAKQHLDEDPDYYKKLKTIHTESREFENKALSLGCFVEDSSKFKFARDRRGKYFGAKRKSDGDFVFFEKAEMNESSATLVAVKQLNG